MFTRALVPADANSVAALWIAGALESSAIEPAFRPRVSVAEYAPTVKAELKTEAIVGWGAFMAEEGGLLGYLTARPTDPSPEFRQAKFLYLLDLDVRQDARRRGIASQLVALARVFAKERGLGSIEVSWLSSDERATAFWRSQGFAPYLARGRGNAA